MNLVIGSVLLLVSFASAIPQKEGPTYTQEAIRQAQMTRLIPADATIQKVINIYLLTKYQLTFLIVWC